MEAGDWKQAVAESALEDGRPVAIEVEGKKLLLVRLEDQIYACGNECSHYHAPLTDGVLAGHVVTCPWHNARFDVRSGGLEAAPGLNDLPTWETRVEGGFVHVRPAGTGTIPMPEGEDERTFLIVGGGAAGGSAAETLRREGFCGRIVLLTDESQGPYDRPNLSKDYLTGDAPAKWLPLRGEKFYARLAVEVLTGKPVTGLQAIRRIVHLADGSTLKAEAILLAPGGRPRTLAVPGAQLPGVLTLRTWADADRILAAIEGSGGAPRAARAVVVGMGFIGLEAASSLRKRGLEVTVVGPEDLPLGRVFGAEIGARLLRLHQEAGVRFQPGRQAVEFRGGERVSEVLLDDGTRLPADFVLVGIGIQPATDFLAGSGIALQPDGSIPVSPRLETSVPGVFAAGDAAAVPDPRAEGLRRVEHWVEAQRQGAHAARGMLGASAPYREVPFFWTRGYGGALRSVGHAAHYERIVFRGDPQGEAFVAGYYATRDGREVLLAAAGVNTAREIIRLGQRLESGRGPSPEQLQDPAFDLLAL